MKKNFCPKNNRVIVELEEIYRKNIKIGDREFIVDPAFRKLWNAVQKAKVVSVDPNITDIQIGDTVYVHHFVSEEERKIPVNGKEYRWLEYNQIYCTVNHGKMKTLSKYVFIEPVTYDQVKFKNKTDSGFRLTKKADTDYIDRVGRVYDIGSMVPNGEIEKGDLVLFGKNCEYEISVEGKILYRMEFRDIVTVIDENEEFVV